MDKENSFVVLLSGRIDSANASEVEKKIEETLSQNKGRTPVFDASELSYISSAGLRVLMKIRKSRGEAITIINVSPEVYEIFDTTGFTELFDVKKRMREVSVEGCEVIGKGFYGTVYRLDMDTIIKVYESAEALSMIQNEKRMAKLAFLAGIPTAISYDIVKVGDSYGSVFEMLRSKTFNDRIIEEPENADDILREYVDFIKLVHGTDMKEGVLPSTKELFLKNVDDLSKGGYLPVPMTERLKELILTMPESSKVVHGDFQMKNVMFHDGEPMLIDMDTLATGDPVFDLGGLYATYQLFKEDEPGNTESFLGISAEMADHIWNKIFELYFSDADPSLLPELQDRIRVAASIRFLTIVTMSGLKDGPLGELRIRHTREHLEELIPRVKGLSVVV